MTRWAIMLLLAAACVAKTAAAEDRQQLDQTTILGNRELPRVTFVTPWREIIVGIPDLPVTRSVDEPLAPLDRETLRIEVEMAKQAPAHAVPGKDAQ